VYPDIVFLYASGHVVVVEVKRSTNPELKDRAVIAQIVDYASSFSALNELQLLELFRRDEPMVETWGELVCRLFPDEVEIDELADLFVTRLASGHVNLVIACDAVPPGLPEIVAGVASQQTLGFDLDLVEVAPYVREGLQTADPEILFVPTTRLATEIVARTAVTVTYRAGDPQPSTEVQTSSVEDIEEQVEAARRSGNPLARDWTPEEVEQEVAQTGDPTLQAFFDFVKNHSAGGKFVAPGRKVNPCFVQLLNIPHPNGGHRRRVICGSVIGWNGVYFSPGALADSQRPELQEQLVQRLHRLFPDEVPGNAKAPGVSLPTLSTKLTEVFDLLCWLERELSVHQVDG
jgi:hypothetical protein